VLAGAAVLLVGAGVAATLAVFLMTPPKGGAVGGGPTPMRLLVPAYFYPGGKELAHWDRLLGSPLAEGTVVIANPGSGPGQQGNEDYVRILDRTQRRGLTAIGYVSTRYGKRPLREVEADVDRWRLFYLGIQGIFFDEQASTADQVPYYAELYEYVKHRRGLSLVVTNPGAVCVEDYLRRPAADVACLAEVTKDFASFRRPAWADNYRADRVAALLCQVETAEHMKRIVREMRDNQIGFCFITDEREPNPWGKLPSYWEAEVEAVQRGGP
jgi:hypothetical protein